MSETDLPDHAEVAPVPPGPERYRYRGPEGAFEFDAWSARDSGRTVERAGHVVEAVDLRTIRWAGDRAGDEVTGEDRDRLAGALAAWYRGQGVPFELHLLSGEIEDETGRRRPGFRGALPRIHHSDGWLVVDEFMSPDFPDAATYPPLIECRDRDGTATMERTIEVADGIRRRVLLADTLRWSGDRAGDDMTDDERSRILGRIRSVYDHVGAPYRIG